MWLELVGYLGTLVVILSFLCKNIKTLRYTSMVACIIFTVYGIFKEDTPIIVTNISIFSIHIFRIIKDGK